jgi:hypothetical protein
MFAQSDSFLAVFLLVFAIFMGLRWRASPPNGTAVVGGAALAVLHVLAYWMSGRTHPNAIGGLLPWNDADGYFSCAHQIIVGAPTSSGCAMRPYYAAVLAGLLGLAQGTAQWALLIQAAMVGAVGAFVAREVWRGHGAAAAIATFAALFVFAGQFVMTMLTENAGLVLGMLAFALLWRQLDSIAPGVFLIVMLVLTVGLNARAGAFAVVPLLLLWSLLWTEGQLGYRTIRTLAGIAGVGLAVGVNDFLIAQLGGSAIGTHSNFAYVLYGVSVGGARYLQILTDHPELNALPGDEFTRAAYRLAIDNFISRPHMLVIGYVRGIAHWLYELFRFVEWWPLRAAFIILWGTGLFTSLWPWRNPCAWRRLMRVFVFGVAVSSPFLTWYGGNRVFAVTHPVDAALIGIGLVTLMSLLGRGANTVAHVASKARLAAVGAVLFVMAPVVGLPLLRAHPTLKPLVVTVECAANELGLVADLGHDSPVLSIVNPGETSIWPLQQEVGAFRALIDAWTAERQHLAELPAGTSLIVAFDRRPEASEHSQLLIWRGDRPEFGVSRICLRPSGPQQWIAEATTIERVR